MNEAQIKLLKKKRKELEKKLSYKTTGFQTLVYFWIGNIISLIIYYNIKIVNCVEEEFMCNAYEGVIFTAILIWLSPLIILTIIYTIVRWINNGKNREELDKIEFKLAGVEKK